MEGPSAAEVLRPATREELVGFIKDARAQCTRIVPVGSCRTLRWVRPSAASSQHVSLDGLAARSEDGIVEYIAGDGVVTVHAGARIGDVQRAVHAGGHRLTPRLTSVELSGTIGGLIARGTSGADRICHGPLRHHVLGLTYVDGTGRIARSGGRLVKNVTGFDVHRLHVGARGTLGALLEVSLRLVPEPLAETVFEHDAPAPHAAIKLAHALRGTEGLRPDLLHTLGSTLAFGFKGPPAHVEDQALRAKGLAAKAGGETREFRREDGAEAAQALIDRTAPPSGAVWSFGVRPSRVLNLIDALNASGVPLEDVHVDPDAARVTVQAKAMGEVHPGGLEGVLHQGARVLAAPPGIEFASGDPESGSPFEARLRAAFDPDGVFSEPAGKAARP